jgi:hypothetical protein
VRRTALAAALALVQAEEDVLGVVAHEWPADGR